MKRIKKFLFGFLKYLFREWIMFYPCHTLRIFFIKLFTQHIGAKVYIGMGLDLRGAKSKIKIGNNVFINRNVLLDGRGELVIGNNVDIGQETNIWTAEHDPNDENHQTNLYPVIIEDYVWIATRVTILPGVKIGKGAVVGAGSIVTKDVPPMTIVAGTPARKIGERKNSLQYKMANRPWFI
jgi:maltose O-acetyltransferase